MIHLDFHDPRPMYEQVVEQFEMLIARGALAADVAQTDGIHLTPSGYSRWVSFLCTQVPYSKNNPWQPGSIWYLDDAVKNLIADIP